MRFIYIALSFVLSGCGTLTTLMCVDDLPGTPYAQFVEMGRLDTHLLKVPDAELGKIYKTNLKKKEDGKDKTTKKIKKTD